MINLEEVRDYLTAKKAKEEVAKKLKDNEQYQALEKEKKAADKALKAIQDKLIAQAGDCSARVKELFDLNLEKVHIESYDYFKLHLEPRIDELVKANGTNKVIEEIRNLLK